MKLYSAFQRARDVPLDLLSLSCVCVCDDGERSDRDDEVGESPKLGEKR